MPVQEFNLIAYPLVKSSWKAPFYWVGEYVIVVDDVQTWMSVLRLTACVVVASVRTRSVASHARVLLAISSTSTNRSVLVGSYSVCVILHWLVFTWLCIVARVAQAAFIRGLGGGLSPPKFFPTFVDVYWKQVIKKYKKDSRKHA